MRLVERGVNQKEPRFINRAVRSLQSLRKRINDGILRKLITAYYPPSKSSFELPNSLRQHGIHYQSLYMNECYLTPTGSPLREGLLEYLEEVRP